VRLLMSPSNPEKIQWTKTPPERSPDGAGSYRICRRELCLPIPDLACCRVAERMTLASFGSFCVVVMRPRSPCSFTLASFGSYCMVVRSPRNPHSFTLASFGSFPVMIMSANLVASLPVASFVTFQIEMADRSPGPKYVVTAYGLRATRP
jgi:hypothetical protein